MSNYIDFRTECLDTELLKLSSDITIDIGNQASGPIQFYYKFILFDPIDEEGNIKDNYLECYDTEINELMLNDFQDNNKWRSNLSNLIKISEFNLDDMLIFCDLWRGLQGHGFKVYLMEDFINSLCSNTAEFNNIMEKYNVGANRTYNIKFTNYGFEIRNI